MQQIRLWLLIVCCSISITAFSQIKNDLTGNWKVVQVVMPPEMKKNNQANIEKLEKIMIQLKFHLNVDGTFAIDSPVDEMRFKKCRWTYNEKDKSISIDGESPNGDKGFLMKLLVSQKNGKWYFAMYETPVTLEVQKTTGAY